MYDSFKIYLIMAWEEIITWIHDNNTSVAGYFLKVFIAVFVYIVASDFISKFFRKIYSGLTFETRGQKAIHIVLEIIRISVMIVMIYMMVSQLRLVELDPIVTMTAATIVVLIMVIHGKLFEVVEKIVLAIYRLIKKDEIIYYSATTVQVPNIPEYTSVGKAFRSFAKFLYKLVGFLVAIVIVFFLYQGVAYLTESGGMEISRYINMPEQQMAKNLETKFTDNCEDIDKIPIYTNEHVKVRSDGDLDIIYINGKQVGVSTTTRKYKFYGVAVNQTEIKAMDKISFKYEGTTQALSDVSSGFSDSMIYYNNAKNTCLIVTINRSSNRVVCVTYITDYETAQNTLKIAD